MILNIKVISNSKKVSVEKLDEITYKVKVDAPAHKGRANRRLIEILSAYFKISKNRVKILAGERAKTKIVEIN